MTASFNMYVVLCGQLVDMKTHPMFCSCDLYNMRCDGFIGPVHWFGQVSAGAALSYTGNHCKGKMPSLMQSRTGWHRYPEKQPGRRDGTYCG
eukprot:COSAG01_NODE_300_length_19226_cov_41.536519_5_plen_92_part_00